MKKDSRSEYYEAGKAVQEALDLCKALGTRLEIEADFIRFRECWLAFWVELPIG